MPTLETYSRALDYSYAPGIFPSMEALKNTPERVRRLLLSSRADTSEGAQILKTLCEKNHVRIEIADKALARISGKENCFAAAVFEKTQATLQKNAPHIVLHHPSDAGNLGTILRTALGMGMKTLPSSAPRRMRLTRTSFVLRWARCFHSGCANTTALMNTGQNLRKTPSIRSCWTVRATWRPPWQKPICPFP